MTYSIDFFSEDISFAIATPEKYGAWISAIVKAEGKEMGQVNFIFCSDNYLHEINLQYLQHDEYTDIITFDNSETDTVIEGDIFISIDRITENANDLHMRFADELDRVMIHGILHLLGYSDKSATEKVVMRKKEEACLSLR